MATRTTRGRVCQRWGQPWVLGMLVLYVGWGSTFPAMRVALRDLPPFLLLSARCLLAGVVLLLLARARRAPLPTASQWAGALAIGSLTLGLGHGLTTWGVVAVPGGTAALLVAMAAIWITVLGWLVLGERPAPRAMLGLAAGFGGLVIVTGWATSATYPLLAVVALLVAPVCWALGSVLSRQVTLPPDTLMSTAAQLLVASPLTAAAGLGAGEWRALDTAAAFTAPALLAFAYLTFCGYVLVFTVYTWLLREAPMSTVGTYAFVNPLVAVFLGVALLGEPLTVTMVIGGVVILAGVALVVLDTQGGMLAPEGPTSVTSAHGTKRGSIVHIPTEQPRTTAGEVSAAELRRAAEG